MRFCLVLLATISALNAQKTPNLDAASIRLGALAYPRVAIDFQGGTAKIKAPAQRIVSLSSHVDEYLYQFLPGERIVGVSNSSYGESFSSVLDKVQKFHPPIVKDAASILRLKPDLVLTSDSMSLDATAELAAAGVPVFSINTTPLTLDEIAANIVALGYVTGADEGAKTELGRFQAEIENVRQQCKAPHGEPRIFGVSMTGFSYGDHTLFQDIMRLVGGTNVAAQNGMHTYQRVDAATVAGWNPDWVFTWAQPGHKDQELQRWMKEDPRLSRTSAATQRHISVSDAKVVLPLSPLTTTFIHTIADAICDPAKR
jgi:iron complex transport system substrate-binding protein